MSTPATVPCPDCGTPARATGQSFCDSCGAFLRWTPSATAPTPDASASTPSSEAAPADEHRPASTSKAGGTPTGESRAAATPAEEPDAPAPAAGRTPSAAGAPDAAEPEAANPAEPATPASAHPAAAAPEATTTPIPAVNDSAATTTPLPTARPTASDAARALLVPVQDPTPAQPPEAPGTVLPGRPEAARPRVRTAAPAPAPENGTPCPACGTPNHQHRNFCRSCATPLTPRRTDNAEGPYAGQRPPLYRDRKRWIARVLITLAVVGLIVGGIFGGPPAARAVQDHFAKRVAVHPTAWKASHSDPKHGPELAFDSYSNTWWGTGLQGDSAGQYLEATFGQPTDLLALLITPGTSKRSGQQSEQARPQEFDLVVTDSSGKAHTSHQSINDGGVQRIDVRVRDAASVRLILRSAFGTAPDKQVAIAELEFFSRSKN
ncbi:NADase-type glycan-binding domain-containing protein [Streptomyces sp. NBC_01431]|uniref:NADase-type glycan-binding domain-containing protein n=1 Tax=Streptomyces sp. NBC_01431 TaxID=2903863 RepID=UPI002E359AF3|nr:zinc ribbon domain-containing protein [Streptomyces sp. NBC_01431]